MPVQSKTQQEQDPSHDVQDDPSVVFSEGAPGQSAEHTQRLRSQRGSSYHVSSGDTLSEIALSVKPPSVELDTMMQAIYAANPEAFFGSIHSLKADVDLRIPPEGQIETLAGQAGQVQASQRKDGGEEDSASGDSGSEVILGPASSEEMNADESAEAEIEAATTDIASAPEVQSEVAAVDSPAVDTSGPSIAGSGDSEVDTTAPAPLMGPTPDSAPELESVSGGREQGATTSEPEEQEAQQSNSILNIDPNAPLTYELIASFLRGLANEQGESSKASLEIDFGARIGGAGRVGGRVRLEIGYKVTDSNFSCLYVHLEGAATAGIDLFGFISVQGEAGFGTTFGQQWFRSSYGAASWLYGALKTANDKCGGMLCFDDDPGNKEDRNPEEEQGARYEISDTHAFAGASAEAKIGNTGIRASRRLSSMNRTYTPVDAEGVGEHGENPGVMHARENHEVTEFGFSVGFGGFNVGASYKGDKEETTGSPVYYANGNFSTHELGINGSYGAIKSKADVVMPDKIQDMVLEVFGTLEAAINFKWLAQLNDSVFNAIVEQLSDGQKTRSRKQAFKLAFQWQEYSEDGHDYDLLYFRVNAVPTMETSTEVQGGVADMSVNTSVTQTERIYESIGSETFGYAQRAFIYSNQERPWEEFVDTNRDEIEDMLVHASDPTHDLYLPTVATAMGQDLDDPNFEAGLLALEQHWTAHNESLNQIQPSASMVAYYINEIGNLNFLNKLWKSDEVDELVAEVDKFAGDPDKLALLFEHAPHYAAGMSRDQLLSALQEICEESGYSGKFETWMATAGITVSGSQASSGSRGRRRRRS